MALTATATIETFQVVSQRLSLRKPVIVPVSLNRGNIKLMVQPFKSLKEFAEATVLGLKCDKQDTQSVIFARSYQDC